MGWVVEFDHAGGELVCAINGGWVDGDGVEGDVFDREPIGKAGRSVTDAVGVQGHENTPGFADVSHTIALAQEVNPWPEDFGDVDTGIHRTRLMAYYTYTTTHFRPKVKLYFTRQNPNAPVEYFLFPFPLPLQNSKMILFAARMCWGAERMKFWPRVVPEAKVVVRAGLVRVSGAR